MMFIGRCFGLGVFCLALLMAGCEGEKNDPTGSESYFENNPYSSDDRLDPLPSTLDISPPVATLDFVGQEVTFTVSGGEGNYHWSTSNNEYGETYSRGANQCLYRCKKVGNNDVIVTDDGGHFASAHISSSTEAMTVTPGSVTLISTEHYVAFTVSGGSAPYTWTSGNANLGTISYSALSSYTAGYTAVSGAYGQNTITVRDAEGRVATATVTQKE
jgi:hypothetical protein